MNAVTETWQSRHRGPYRFYVTRSNRSQLGFKTAWLTGSTQSEDVEQEAQALLTDPRDTIFRVNVWSVREGQFVMTYEDK